MRINKFIAQATGLSRRAADAAINSGRVTVDGRPAEPGDIIDPVNIVRLDNVQLKPPRQVTMILLHKPVGYVCSRQGQGGRTIYELLPESLRQLKSVGRLDKNSSGLLLLTNDGDLANRLTHPRYSKEKVYEVKLDKPLTPTSQTQVAAGVELTDGLSQLQVSALDTSAATYKIVMSEGRNRQIRRTFEALGYAVTQLHRTQFGEYKLPEALPAGQFQTLSNFTKS